MLETPLVVVCATALPSTRTTHTNKAAANDHAEGLPIMSDRTPINFLRIKNNLFAEGNKRIPLLEDSVPDIPIRKQAKAEYAKLQ